MADKRVDVSDDEVAAALEGRSVASRTHMYLYSTERCMCGEEYSDSHIMRFILEYVKRATDPPQYEYGTSWPLSEEAHGSGKVHVAPEKSLKEARETLQVVDGYSDRESQVGIKVVRRIKAGEWEEVENDEE